ncbi:MAG: NAD-dependent epimerase/dehydratase family protein, partial [Planctomycetota bacterium]|nr:NAD-dependent epimerase/dehydratase family protein [Planctomycetota bacterium]
MAGPVAVTGGAGFIGSHVVGQLLASGHHVRVLDNLSTGHRANLPAGLDGTFQQGDCTNAAWVREALQGRTAVIHLAATPNVQKSLDDPPEILHNNIQATACVLEAARRLRIRRVVLASSAGLYAADEEPPHHEEMTPCPGNPY